MTEYMIATVVRCSVTISVGGVNTDPTALTFKYTNPAKVTTTYVYGTDAALAKDATGKYHVDIDTTAASGSYFYRFVSTGTAAGAAEGSFGVAPSEI